MRTPPYPNGYTVQLYEDYPRAVVCIRVVRYAGYEEREVMQQDGTFKLVKTGQPVRPTFELPRDMWQQVVDAIHKDFKPSEGKYTEGKLEATERHLSDLRTLLKIRP